MGAMSNEDNIDDYDFDAQWSTDTVIEMTPEMSIDDLQRELQDALADLPSDIVDVYQFGFPEEKDRKGAWGVFQLCEWNNGELKREPDYWTPAAALKFERECGQPRLIVDHDGDGDAVRGFGFHLIPLQDLIDSVLNPDRCEYGVAGVYAIVCFDVDLVIPVSSDAVILVRTYHSGRRYEITVRSGEQWRENHRKYGLFYRNDPKEEGLVLEAVESLEDTLRHLIDTGANPHRHDDHENDLDEKEQ